MKIHLRQLRQIEDGQASDTSVQIQGKLNNDFQDQFVKNHQNLSDLKSLISHGRLYRHLLKTTLFSKGTRLLEL